MLALVAGLALIVFAATVFYLSLPRDGRVARFVGTEWEGYAVVGMIGLMGIGVIATIVGTISLFKAA